MDQSDTQTAFATSVRNARIDELDEVARLLGEVYGEFRMHFPVAAWEHYPGEIVDVSGPLATSEVIVAQREGRLVGTIGLYPDASRSSLEAGPRAGLRSGLWECSATLTRAGRPKRSNSTCRRLT